MEDKNIIDFMNKEIKKALYPNEEEMKDLINKVADTSEIVRLSRENAYLKEVIRRKNEILEIFRRNIRLDENYSTDSNGSTRAVKMLVENCFSVEEDEQYTDECCPNSDFDKIEEWMIYGR